MPRGKQFAASHWNPPEGMLKIAHERTRDIVGAWSQQLAWGPVDFNHLAESCYMQGVNDSVEALVVRKLQITPVPQDPQPATLSLYGGY
jgi:hypothetical protein